MTVARQRLGHEVEEMVAVSLVREGMAIVARNARASGIRGEIEDASRGTRKLPQRSGRCIPNAEFKSILAG